MRGKALGIIGIILFVLVINSYCEENKLAPVSQTGLIKITSPAEGTNFHPGDTIDVTIEAKDSVKGAVLMGVCFDAGKGANPIQLRDKISGVHKLIIPLFSLGRFNITAVAPPEYASVGVNVILPPSIFPTRIEACDKSIIYLLSGGDTLPLFPSVFFSDGVKRRVAKATGVKYEVIRFEQNRTGVEVIRVSDDGLITTVNPGQAWLKVSYGPVSAKYWVEVSKRDF